MDKELRFNTLREFRARLKEALDFIDKDPENEVVITRNGKTYILFLEGEDNETEKE